VVVGLSGGRPDRVGGSSRLRMVLRLGRLGRPLGGGSDPRSGQCRCHSCGRGRGGVCRWVEQSCHRASGGNRQAGCHRARNDIPLRRERLTQVRPILRPHQSLEDRGVWSICWRRRKRPRRRALWRKASADGLAPADPEMAGSDRRRRALRQADDRGRRQVERKGEARFLIAAGTSVMAARLSKGSVPGCVTPRSPSWRHGPEVLSAPDPEVS
jgi:hypothetical protein